MGSVQQGKGGDTNNGMRGGKGVKETARFTVYELQKTVQQFKDFFHSLYKKGFWGIQLDQFCIRE